MFHETLSIDAENKRMKLQFPFKIQKCFHFTIIKFQIVVSQKYVCWNVQYNTIFSCRLVDKE